MFSSSCLLSLVFPQYRLVAELFQHLDDGEALADSFRHPRLLPRHGLGLFNHLWFFLPRDEDNPAAVRDDEISRTHLNSGELDLLVKRILHYSPSRSHGNHRARVNRKSHFPALVDISTGPVNDHAAQPFRPGCQGQESAPGGNVRPSAAVDDDNVSRLSRINRGCAEM